MSESTTITPELVADESKELLAVVQQNALPPAVAQSLQSSFAPLFSVARGIIEQSRAIVVTDASQKLQIKLAGTYRKELKAQRVAAEKLKDELKRQSLRESNAVQGFYNIFLHLVSTEEERLDEQEKFAEVAEAKRQEALKVQRTEALLAINADPTLYSLGAMSEGTFQQLVEGVKLVRAAAESRRLKEEADRIAKDAADLAERERVRLENERLKREADEKAAAEKLDRERRNNLHFERRLLMHPLVASGDESAGYYGDMTDEQFGEAKAGAENRRESRLKAEHERTRLEAIAADERRKAAEAAEIARKEREAIEARAAEEKRQADVALAEQKRVADETAVKIRSDADERARKANVEADKRATILKEENDRVKAQLKVEKDAQAERAAYVEEAERKAAAASAKDKLLTYANAIRAIEIPTDAQAIATVIKASRDKFCDWVEEKAGGL